MMVFNIVKLVRVYEKKIIFIRQVVGGFKLFYTQHNSNYTQIKITKQLILTAAVNAYTPLVIYITVG